MSNEEQTKKEQKQTTATTKKEPVEANNKDVLDQTRLRPPTMDEILQGNIVNVLKNLRLWGVNLRFFVQGV